MRKQGINEEKCFRCDVLMRIVDDNHYKCDECGAEVIRKNILSNNDWKAMASKEAK